LSDDLLGYVGSEDENHAASEATLRDLESVRDVFTSAFGTEDGKKVLVFLKDFCHQSRASYVPNEPLETAYYEGRRSVILLVMKYLYLDDEEMIRMAATRAQRRVRN
jgi:hypothetical protein